jgi:hypothetical protein
MGRQRGAFTRRFCVPLTRLRGDCIYWKADALLVFRMRELVIAQGTSAGVDAHTTAGLETGAPFRPLQNHAVSVLAAQKVFGLLNDYIAAYVGDGVG